MKCMQIRYKFVEVVASNGSVGAALRKLPDFTFFGLDNGVGVWESEEECRKIFSWAAQEEPQTRKTREIQREMMKALEAIAAYKKSQSDSQTSD